MCDISENPEKRSTARSIVAASTSSFLAERYVGLSAGWYADTGRARDEMRTATVTKTVKPTPWPDLHRAEYRDDDGLMTWVEYEQVAPAVPPLRRTVGTLGEVALVGYLFACLLKLKA